MVLAQPCAPPASTNPLPLKTRGVAGTICAAVSYTLGDLHRKGSILDYPVGGSAAVCDSLVTAMESHGGRMMLRTPVEKILIEECVPRTLRPVHAARRRGPAPELQAEGRAGGAGQREGVRRGDQERGHHSGAARGRQ